MEVSLVVNLHSSGSQRQLEELARLFEPRGIRVAEVMLVRGGATVEKQVKKARKRGARAILVGGGDGAMTAAVNALAYSETVLGVLPLGTGNSFAQSLGIRPRLEDAVDVIAGGRIARVDLGIINQRYFANFTVIGLPAQIAETTPRGWKRVAGAFAYALAGAAPLFTHRSFRAKIRWDEGRMMLETRQIVIASGRYFGSSPLLPDASITDGKLAFFTTTGTTPLEMLRTYLGMAVHLQTRLPDARTFESSKIVVRAKPKQPVSTDGAAFGVTPVRFGIAPRALRVFVPATFEGAE